MTTHWVCGVHFFRSNPMRFKAIGTTIWTGPIAHFFHVASEMLWIVHSHEGNPTESHPSSVSIPIHPLDACDDSVMRKLVSPEVGLIPSSRPAACRGNTPTPWVSRTSRCSSPNVLQSPSDITNERWPMLLEISGL